MSQYDDLGKLFNRFGVKPGSYREIVQEDAAKEALQRWPLLAALQPDQDASVSPLHTVTTVQKTIPVAATPRSVVTALDPKERRAALQQAMQRQEGRSLKMQSASSASPQDDSKPRSQEESQRQTDQRISGRACCIRAGCFATACRNLCAPRGQGFAVYASESQCYAPVFPRPSQAQLSVRL
ncbi:cellulose biosynthesis protein BcsP [Cupriavidus sp. AcVe19-6a]|uniref:cellulose biosynthesis protein BcsP n=1 Tax=Cupriavidus sp. AcVe19-6a TaxID=2821358 RepID=UPI001AEA0CFF|nr:cellulose biosynthesis protein BcsP [Cupriavidus sp. AcVe19-6a]MBP0639840.1 hypothetical protein [Cupriavidus sp. AcVe19-6a]